MYWILEESVYFLPLSEIGSNEQLCPVTKHEKILSIGNIIVENETVLK